MKVELLTPRTVPYPEAQSLQLQIQDEIIRGERGSTLILLEHPPVLTLGAGFHTENLLYSREEYNRRGITIETTERGGDITYHAPGQLVIYPIFDLRELKTDLHWWLRSLEQMMIEALATFGLEGERVPPHTGIWLGSEKVCAIGIKVKRWVSIHGLALNCNCDLAPFSWIIPCGIVGKGVTSLSKALGRDVSTSDAIQPVLDSFANTFGCEFSRSNAVSAS